MPFHVNAEDIFLHSEGALFANLPNEDGDLVNAYIDLNECLGNNNGTSRPASVSSASIFQTS